MQCCRELPCPLFPSSEDFWVCWGRGACLSCPRQVPCFLMAWVPSTQMFPNAEKTGVYSFSSSILLAKLPG